MSHHLWPPCLTQCLTQWAVQKEKHTGTCAKVRPCGSFIAGMHALKYGANGVRNLRLAKPWIMDFPHTPYLTEL